MQVRKCVRRRLSQIIGYDGSTHTLVWVFDVRPLELHPIAAALMGNAADRRTVAEWSKPVAMSEGTLTRLVLAETGMTRERLRSDASRPLKVHVIQLSLPLRSRRWALWEVGIAFQAKPATQAPRVSRCSRHLCQKGKAGPIEKSWLPSARRTSEPVPAPAGRAGRSMPDVPSVRFVLSRPRMPACPKALSLAVARSHSPSRRVRRGFSMLQR
jgi:AraC-like DNA-binding protein